MVVRRGMLLAVMMLALTGGRRAPAAEELKDAVQLQASLKYQQGIVNLGSGLAKLNIPAAFRYLGASDARKVLVDLWHNPPASGDTLGMILPADRDPIDDDCWAVIITWTGDGHINDDEASSIDYDALLKSMQAGVREANRERVKEGYPPVELVGWALPPRYDRASHKLHWAKELKFGDLPRHTLNYCIRILGRRGVLELNTVADMDQIQSVSKATPQLLKMIEFQEGNRYVDFNPDTDQVAAYGLAALVAGGVAAKTGLLKGLLVAILAAKKFVFVAIIALIALFRKFFARLFDRSAE